MARKVKSLGFPIGVATTKSAMVLSVSHLMARWKVLKSQDLFKSGFFRLRVDECELPDGRIMPRYYVIEFPDWVNVVPVTDDGQMVLVEQYRHGVVRLNQNPNGDPAPASDQDSKSRAPASNQASNDRASTGENPGHFGSVANNGSTANHKEIFLEIPGGSTDPKNHEDPRLAGVRELREETGYEAREWVYCGFHYPNPALQTNKMHTFVAFGCTKVGEPMLDPYEDLKVSVLPVKEVYRRWYAGEIKHSLIFTSLGLAIPHLRKAGFEV